MAQLSVCLLVILSVSCIKETVERSFAGQSRPRTYIEESCRSTQYPALCVHCLSGFPKRTLLKRPQELAQLSLSVSLYRARITKAYLVKVGKELKAVNSTEYQTVEDCKQQINNGIEQLSQSIKELRRLGKARDAVNDDSILHISNVETWVKAALTHASTCVDQFPVHNMSKLKATIEGKVLNVAQVTSNALAFFHRYAARFRAGAAKKP